jgi:hypothetical protein
MATLFARHLCHLFFWTVLGVSMSRFAAITLLLVFACTGCSTSRPSSKQPSRFTYDLKPIAGFQMAAPLISVENRFITVSGEVTATSKSESAAAPPPMHVHLEFLVGADKAVDDFSMTLKPDNEISPTKWTYSMRYGWIPEKWDKLSLVMTDDSHFAPTPSSGANTMSGNRFTRTPGTPKQQRQTGTPKRSSGGSRSHK